MWLHDRVLTNTKVSRTISEVEVSGVVAIVLASRCDCRYHCNSLSEATRMIRHLGLDAMFSTRLKEQHLVYYRDPGQYGSKSLEEVSQSCDLITHVPVSGINQDLEKTGPSYSAHASGMQREILLSVLKLGIWCAQSAENIPATGVKATSMQ